MQKASDVKIGDSLVVEEDNDTALLLIVDACSRRLEQQSLPVIPADER